jgi:hypothetical protein
MIEGFNNGDFTAKLNITAKRSLKVGSGSLMTSSGGGTMTSSGPNGISAGSCTTNSSKYCTHMFSTPYSTTPICTTTGTNAAANSGGIIVCAASRTVVNWISIRRQTDQPRLLFRQTSSIPSLKSRQLSGTRSLTDTPKFLYEVLQAKRGESTREK